MKARCGGRHEARVNLKGVTDEHRNSHETSICTRHDRRHVAVDRSKSRPQSLPNLTPRRAGIKAKLSILSRREDDHTEEAREGSRASENERDVKEDQGAAGVDGKDVNSSAKQALNLPGNQDDVQMDIGVTSKATGEDPQNETDRTKPGKDDSDTGDGGSQGRGQTSHPARTDNDEIDGHKWSSSIKNLYDLIKTAESAGNDALAAISGRGGRRHQEASRGRAPSDGRHACRKEGRRMQLLRR